jgi:hypothetical protein
LCEAYACHISHIACTCTFITAHWPNHARRCPHRPKASMYIANRSTLAAHPTCVCIHCQPLQQRLHRRWSSSLTRCRPRPTFGTAAVETAHARLPSSESASCPHGGPWGARHEPLEQRQRLRHRWPHLWGLVPATVYELFVPIERGRQLDGWALAVTHPKDGL